MGFAALGGGYLALALVVLTEVDLARLPTSRLLLHVHRQAVPTRAATALVAYTVPARTKPAASFLFPEPPGPRVVRVTRTVPNPSSALWGALLPGAVDYKSFGVVGHCLFALAVGWLGAVGSRRIWGRPGSGSSPSLRIGDLDRVIKGLAEPQPKP